MGAELLPDRHRKTLTMYIKLTLAAIFVAVVIWFSIESNPQKQRYLVTFERYSGEIDTITVESWEDRFIQYHPDGCVEVSGVPMVCGVRAIRGITIANNTAK